MAMPLAVETFNGDFNVSKTAGGEADSINLLLALTPAVFLARLSSIPVGQGIFLQRQTWGQKAPSFG